MIASLFVANSLFDIPFFNYYVNIDLHRLSLLALKVFSMLDD